jgi:serine/threonine protein kinase
MRSEEWVQVKEVFAELAGSDTAARDARLHDLDDSVRREVEWLLANHDEAADEQECILNKPALDSPALLEWLGDAQVFAPGQVLLDRFEIIRLIGRGGMGEVYEALDADHPELIAIKTIRLELLSDPGVRERFRTEVQRSRQVSHENVCRVHELFTGTAGDNWHLPFFTMELLRGETLYERVRRSGPLPPWEARSVAHQVCAGLDAAHRCGVVHRDLKSGNVILLQSVNGERPLHAKITDFGLARELPPNRDSYVTATLPDGARNTRLYGSGTA